MPTTLHKSSLAVIAALTCSALAVAGVATLPAASAAASPTISIDDPGAVSAGRVDLTGRLFQGTAETTTVLYVVDATDSTELPAGGDCDGDGAVTGAAAVVGGDNLNGDAGIGDTLDCEISAVRAMDSSLAASAGGSLQVGLMAFANAAAAADLSPTASALFVPPGYTGGDAVPRVVAAATSVKRDCRAQFPGVRNCIGAFDFKDLQGSGAAEFGIAVDTALATLGQAPAGPKWVIFLSDGAAPLDVPAPAPGEPSPTVVALAASGAHVRTFAIGGSADCSASGGLAKMAAATGETCVDVNDPASLAASLQGSSPEGINGVTVTIDGVAFAADVDPVGAWRVGLTIGSGTYTATVTATMSSGVTVTARRTFTVTAGGSGAPPPGSVGGAAGTLFATQVAVRRPAPLFTALPKRVTGVVGTPGHTPKTTKRLNGATVLLQGQAGAGAPWVTVGRSTVSKGAFALKWKRRAAVRSLRVALQPYKLMARSVSAVPVAPISACRKVNGRGQHWTLTCHTTAKKGTHARLFDGKRLVDRAKVAKGVVRVSGNGKIGRFVLVVDVSRKTHIRLAL